MCSMIWIYTGLLLFGYCSAELINSETEGTQFIQSFNTEAAKLKGEEMFAKWNYQTNVSPMNSRHEIATSRKYRSYRKNKTEEATEYNWQGFTDAAIQRQFKKLVSLTKHNVDDTEEELVKTIASMLGMYHGATICPDGGSNNCLTFEGEFNEYVAPPTDEKGLLAVWKEWRDAIGAALRPRFAEYVKLVNMFANLTGYKDYSAFINHKFESSTFEADMQRILSVELRPLYEQLHSFVRRKLIARYGGKSFPSTGQIPAHLVDRLWGDNWVNLYDIVKPYPKVDGLDVTKKLLEKGNTVHDLVNMAQDFYTSLGFEPMTQDFRDNSIFTRPNVQSVSEFNCQPKAFDFSNGNDYRIKMCAKVTEKDALTIHSQMGHTVYQMSYRQQPYLFREGANKGFTEAMKGLSKLSFLTQEHFKEIGLTSVVTSDNKRDINNLMKLALETVASLPFDYITDRWRWDVFRGKITGKSYSRDWWKMRCMYQGVSPPVERTEWDFDPGSVYQLSANGLLIEKFVSTILMFQWQKALCNMGPQSQQQLYRCDIYRNTAAGNKLKEMLALGSSRQWQEALNLLTRSRTMSAMPLREYFKPLNDWLTIKNRGHRVGWDDVCPDQSASPASQITLSSTCIIMIMEMIWVFLL
ncbi:angiotensin-converting enzyme-like [Ylistrum balloti]|uniref:angiotensin-converting enzyme-like n=1 Tax=Ylistrum balloti TaxID=509963 RepID=UPI00290591BF|nr:angiotensin-converting enzyme-like [Ylistrum balloti]